VSFKDIKGQDKAVSFLRGLIKSGRIGHAYIFNGPSGVGKKLTAINLAKAANCIALAPAKSADSALSLDVRSDLIDACGECISCRKIDSFNHPDVFLLKPEKEGASLKIDSIRAMIRDIGLKPYEGRKKFYVIDEAGSLTEEASNALLKTLEEPPSDSVLILIVESLSSLLPTIVSRAQAIKFFPLGINEVKELLVNNHAVDGPRAHILSHLSSGRLGEALKYKDESFFARRGKVISALASGAFFESDFDKLSKTELRANLDIMLTWYRDILVTKAAGQDQTEIMNIDVVDVIMKEAKRMAFGKIEKAVKQIIATYSYIEQNANPKLAMAALGTVIV
jgi:DNA polymerase III, gamma/tau subunits